MATILIVKIAIREAKNNLSKYGNLAHSGSKVTVCKNGKPWFDLVPHAVEPRSVEPLVKGGPRISAKQATAPVDSQDLEGWI